MEDFFLILNGSSSTSTNQRRGEAGTVKTKKKRRELATGVVEGQVMSHKISFTNSLQLNRQTNDGLDTFQHFHSCSINNGRISSDWI